MRCLGRHLEGPDRPGESERSLLGLPVEDPETWQALTGGTRSSQATLHAGARAYTKVGARATARTGASWGYPAPRQSQSACSPQPTFRAGSRATWQCKKRPTLPPPGVLREQKAARALGVSVDFLEDHVLPELRVVRVGRRRLIAVAGAGAARLAERSERALAGLERLDLSAGAGYGRDPARPGHPAQPPDEHRPPKSHAANRPEGITIRHSRRCLPCRAILQLPPPTRPRAPRPRPARRCGEASRPWPRQRPGALKRRRRSAAAPCAGRAM